MGGMLAHAAQQSSRIGWWPVVFYCIICCIVVVHAKSSSEFSDKGGFPDPQACHCRVYIFGRRSCSWGVKGFAGRYLETQRGGGVLWLPGNL